MSPSCIKCTKPKNAYPVIILQLLLFESMLRRWGGLERTVNVPQPTTLRRRALLERQVPAAIELVMMRVQLGPVSDPAEKSRRKREVLSRVENRAHSAETLQQRTDISYRCCKTLFTTFKVYKY